MIQHGCVLPKRKIVCDVIPSFFLPEFIDDTFAKCVIDKLFAQRKQKQKKMSFVFSAYEFGDRDIYYYY